jgi:hypothetical protein
MPALDDALDGAAHLIHIRPAELQPAPAGFRVADDRGDWLIYFMRNRRGHLAQRGHARDIGEVCLRRAQVLLCAFGCGDVHQAPMNSS